MKLDPPNPYESPQADFEPLTPPAAAEGPASGQRANTIGTCVSIGLGLLFTLLLLPALSVPLETMFMPSVVGLCSWASVLGVGSVGHLLRMRHYRRRNERLLRGACIVMGIALPWLAAAGVLLRVAANDSAAGQ